LRQKALKKTELRLFPMARRAQKPREPFPSPIWRFLRRRTEGDRVSYSPRERFNPPELSTERRFARGPAVFSPVLDDGKYCRSPSRRTRQDRAGNGRGGPISVFTDLSGSPSAPSPLEPAVYTNRFCNKNIRDGGRQRNLCRMSGKIPATASGTNPRRARAGNKICLSGKKGGLIF